MFYQICQVVPPMKMWFLGSHKSTLQSISQLVQAFFMTNRQTVKLCYVICSNRSHLASAVMQPKEYCFCHTFYRQFLCNNYRYGHS